MGAFSLRRRKLRGEETIPGVAHQAARTSLPGTVSNSKERHYGQRPINIALFFGFNVERLCQPSAA
jgi:hypothetical protein